MRLYRDWRDSRTENCQRRVCADRHINGDGDARGLSDDYTRAVRHAHADCHTSAADCCIVAQQYSNRWTNIYASAENYCAAFSG